MKARNAADAYPPEVQAEVSAACRENRAIVLPSESLEKLGHGPRNPVKVMRAFCVDCMGGNRAEVRRCTSVGCALWPYRMGRNPFSNRTGPSPELQKATRQQTGRLQNQTPTPTEERSRTSENLQQEHRSGNR